MRWTIGITVGIWVIIFIIMAATESGKDTDKWKGKWLNVGKGDEGTFVCTKKVPSTSSTCPATFQKLGAKCFKYVSRKMKRPEAHKYCGTMDGGVGASLAKIENAAEDKFAFSMCKGSDANLCLLGLQPVGSSRDGDKWKWMDNAPAKYTNWWTVEDDHEEPTDEADETTVSWLNDKLHDEIMVGAFIAFIVGLVTLLLLIAFCSVDALLFHCGIVKKNKCCVCTAISLDGVVTTLCVLGAAGAAMRADWEGLSQSLFLGGCFLSASILGCMLCNKVEGTGGGAGGGPVQQEGAVVGQPIEVLGGST